MSPRKNTAVTATTGMASTQLGMGATTLHHWCGIMDCRYSQERLHELMRSDDRFAAAKDRIQKQKFFSLMKLVCCQRKCLKLLNLFADLFVGMPIHLVDCRLLAFIVF